MQFRRDVRAFLLTALIGSAGQGLAEETLPKVDVGTLSSAIKTFGLSAEDAEQAAKSAAAEIAQRNRSSEQSASEAMVQAPDDLLDISPY